jgi:hypothetical protein
MVEPRSPWFEEWPATTYGWRVGPIAGMKYSQEYVGDDRVHAVSVETGVLANVRGLQFVPGNPGFTAQVGAGAAWGKTDRLVVANGNDFTSKGHDSDRRLYADLGGIWLWHWLRQELSLTRGRKDFSDATVLPVQSVGMNSDTGVLMLRHWSQHYTIRLTRGHADRLTRPILFDQDHWMHSRVFARYWNAYADFGHGHTVTRIYMGAVGGKTNATLAEGQSDYLRIKAGSRVWWKLGAAGDAKYVYASTERRLGEFAPPLMPEESLNKVPTVAQPKDSLYATAFFGARDLAWGLGVGWQVNWLFFHMRELDGSDAWVVRSQGLAVSFDKEF